MDREGAKGAVTCAECAVGTPRGTQGVTEGGKSVVMGVRCAKCDLLDGECADGAVTCAEFAAGSMRCAASVEGSVFGRKDPRVLVPETAWGFLELVVAVFLN